VKSKAFYEACKGTGRLSPTVEAVPLYLVLIEDTGERGALFAAVAMLLQE
jgi:glucokinase